MPRRAWLAFTLLALTLTSFHVGAQPANCIWNFDIPLPGPAAASYPKLFKPEKMPEPCASFADFNKDWKAEVENPDKMYKLLDTLSKQEFSSREEAVGKVAEARIIQIVKDAAVIGQQITEAMMHNYHARALGYKLWTLPHRVYGLKNPQHVPPKYPLNWKDAMMWQPNQFDALLKYYDIDKLQAGLGNTDKRIFFLEYIGCQVV